MNLSQRIEAFSVLGSFLQKYLSNNSFTTEDIPHTDQTSRLSSAIKQAHAHNQWFTIENILFALESIAQNLTRQKISSWTRLYPSIQSTPRKHVTFAVIMAGNIPLVGFHDFLSVLISGNRILAKVSSKDAVLINFLADFLIEIQPEFNSLIKITDDKISDFDAVIATGSDNSSRYFDYYFRTYPTLIRKNRTSAAILNGKETDEDLAALAKDIFMYFGLGCRNISKIFVPANYDFTRFFHNTESFSHVINHNKYANNYDYNKAVYLVNNIPHLDNGYLMVKEDTHLFSPVGVVFYEYYEDLQSLTQQIMLTRDKIQCIVTNEKAVTDKFPFGEAQKPTLIDYADGADTLHFVTDTVKHLNS